MNKKELLQAGKKIFNLHPDSLIDTVGEILRQGKKSFMSYGANDWAKSIYINHCALFIDEHEKEAGEMKTLTIDGKKLFYIEDDVADLIVMISKERDELKSINRNMFEAEHKQVHIDLHKALDKLLADFIAQTGKLPSKTPLTDLLEWSYQQTLEPTGKNNTP